MVGLADGAGTVLNQYSYDIWGSPITEQESVPNPFRYSGELWDDTTQLQYLRARWYDPGMGRFINEDTYEGSNANPLSLNLYTYVENNPLRWIDPTGHYKDSDNEELRALLQPQTYAWDAAYRAGDEAGMKDAETMADAIRVSYYGRSNLPDDVKYRINTVNMLIEQQYGNASEVPFSEDPIAQGILMIAPSGSLKFGKTFKLCNCFTAGTKVLTDEGEKPIEEIVVGDKVLAKSDETGEVAYKEVVGLFQKQADEIYYLHVGDEIIEVTAEHPFWLAGKGWTEVKDLKVGDLLVTSDGATLAIEKIEKEPREETVYNFEVADFQSYFVSNLGIWVHNCNVIWKSVKSFGHTFSTHGAGTKNTKSLIDRARGTGNDQGQWLDNQKGAEFLNSLGKITEVREFDLPSGLGQVITPSGEIINASRVRVVPSVTGIKTAFPIR